jgi:hypothetical protein
MPAIRFIRVIRGCFFFSLRIDCLPSDAGATPPEPVTTT